MGSRVTETELEDKTDRLLANIKELHNLEIINTKQYHDLVKRTKAWWYDQREAYKKDWE